jgi:hypothetical protein
MPRALPAKRYDPTNFLAYDQHGNEVSLDKLTHDELLQAACEAIQMLELIDCQSHSIAQLIEGWRKGNNPAIEVEMDN